MLPEERVFGVAEIVACDHIEIVRIFHQHYFTQAFGANIGNFYYFNCLQVMEATGAYITNAKTRAIIDQ